MLLGDPAGRPLCEPKLICLANSWMALEGQSNDGQEVYSNYIVMCNEGFSFPDGARIKMIYCERVVDEKGRVITQWQKLDGRCKG